jgi:outer membrane protein insertion porin family/translocation and assembly module TamA
MTTAARQGAPVALALCLIACSKVPAGRLAIDAVTVTNLHTVPASDVEERLATAASPKFLGLFRGVVYDYTIFDESSWRRDLERVERYLRGHGFLDAKAHAGNVVRVGRNHVRLEIVADEGPATLNRTVAVLGIEQLLPEDKARVVAAALSALPAGARFDESAFESAAGSVKRVLTDRGYAFAKVTGEGQLDRVEHVADYIITIVPGPIATFGAVRIVGLDPDGAGPRRQEIPERSVRRALQIREGTLYSTAKIDSGQDALAALAVFSAVEVVPTLPDPPPADDVVPLTVRLEPTRLREVKLGGGAEFDVFKTDLHLLAGWEDHNFLGGLRDFSVQLKPGVVLYPTRIDNLAKPTNPLLEEHFRAQLRQPGFLEARTTGFIRPEFNVFPLLVAPDPPASDPVVGYVEAKGTIGVDRTFWKRLYVSVGYTAQVEDPFVYVGELNSALKVLVLGYPQLVTNLDFRDNAVTPHTGFYLGNTLQVAGGIFGGDARDVRVQPEVRTYVPLGKHVTFATRASLGFLFNFNYASSWQRELAASEGPQTPTGLAQLQRDIETMYFRGFFSGGSNTNRGFPLFGVSPYGVVPFLNPATAANQVSLGCDPSVPGYNASQCFIPVGGSTLWELSNELRIQVAGPFSLAAFCDMGDVSPNQADVRLTHLHLSCGLGGRYDTPVGPIRFDIGYRIQPLQVIPFRNEVAAAAASGAVDGVNPSPVNGTPPTIFGLPVALSIGIGEAF